jgi:hypothetical protein
LNNRNRDKVLPPSYYGRAQFLGDAAWLGLGRDEAFSRTDLRRQRDRLMHIHHPDRGGSAAMAAQINMTYSRMITWLDRHLENRSYLHMRRERALAQGAARSTENPSGPSEPKSETTGIYTAILGITATAAALGFGHFLRRRR